MSSITADTASRKDLTLQGCTKVSTSTSTLFARSINIHPSVCRRGLSHDVPRPKASTGATPPSRHPQRSRPVSETDSGFASVAVCDSKSPNGDCPYREITPLPKQYRCYMSHNLNKAVKHGIKSQTSLWPPVQY